MRSPIGYDVSLSFAGEDREYVESVAAALRAANVSVFYDAYEEVALWGRDLYQHLDHVYSTSHFCVIFVSEAYARKLWTRHELRSAQARALTEQREYILPARFDATEIPGLPTTIAYVDLSTKTPAEFAQLIVRKLKDAQRGARAAAPSPSPHADSARGRPSDSARIGWRALTVGLVLLVTLALVLDQALRWSDQQNCEPGEQWVGMRPHRAEWAGDVSPAQAQNAVFYGELRWAPEVEQVKRTTVGRVELEVDGRTTVIYAWDSPKRSTHAFSVKVDRFLVGTSGRFKVRWVWEDGTSGVCIAKSFIKG